MLAEVMAIGLVTLAVLGPGSYLLHVAWRRRGAARLLAVTVLVAMAVLVAWLLLPIGPEMTQEQRISQFAGAWGILFMALGLGVIAGVFVNWVRTRRRSRRVD